MALDLEAVLRHGAALQLADSFDQLLSCAAIAVDDLDGYRHTWIARAVDAERGIVAMHQAHLRDGLLTLDPAVELPVAGDPIVAEVMEGRRAVVIVDARTDPRTNPAIVELFESRTAVNVPLASGAKVLGSLGAGTCGDVEGVRPPTDEQVAMLTLFALQLAAAVERLAAIEQGAVLQREKDALGRRLEQLQRIESVALLTSGVAHDFNNLLAVVRSAFDELRGLEMDDARREALEDGAEASARCQRLARDLLSIARTKSEVRRCSLDERARGVVQLVRSSIPPGITLTIAAGSSPDVDADPGRLDQLLANLVLNARDALGARGRITLTVDEVELGTAELLRDPRVAPGRFARLRVVDDGPGVPADLRERIFEPFFTTKSTGTGMGLAIVTQVVRQHGGVLRCESEPGAGSCFEICLPLAASA